MLKALALKALEYVEGLLGAPATSTSIGPLVGLTLRPFDRDSTEPYQTFAAAMTKELMQRGVAFSSHAELTCLLDWEFMGGRQLRLRAAARVGELLITTDVRESNRDREEADFDIERTGLMNGDRKRLLFIERAAEKICDTLVVRYHRDLGRATRE